MMTTRNRLVASLICLTAPAAALPMNMRKDGPGVEKRFRIQEFGFAP